MGNVSYTWEVTAGTITSGQGSSSITVDTAGLGGQTVTATVTVDGLGADCKKTASCPTEVKTPPTYCEKFDEYGDIRFDDEKARLDNYVIALNKVPDSTAYIVAYGTCAGNGLCSNPSCIVAQKRLERAKKYMTDPSPNRIGFDANRIVVIDGGCRSEVMVELWVCPKGAPPPTASAAGNTVDPCPDCKPTPKPRPRHRRRVRGSED